MNMRSTKNIKIAIRFGDNDFYYTWVSVLRVILDSWRYGHTEVPMDKDKLIIIINELSLGCYLVNQNQFRYTNSDTMEGHIEHIREYLKIGEKKLLVGGEVDKYLEKVDWDNGETYILDTSLDYPNNNPIYCR